MQGVLNLSLFPFDTSMPAPFGTNDRATSATHQCNVDLDGKTEGGRATHTHTPADVDDEAASTFGDVRATGLAVPFFAGPWPYAEVCLAFRLAPLFSFAR